MHRRPFAEEKTAAELQRAGEIKSAEILVLRHKLSEAGDRSLVQLARGVCPSIHVRSFALSSNRVRSFDFSSNRVRSFDFLSNRVRSFDFSSNRVRSFARLDGSAEVHTRAALHSQPLVVRGLRDGIDE